MVPRFYQVMVEPGPGSAWTRPKTPSSPVPGQAELSGTPSKAEDEYDGQSLAGSEAGSYTGSESTAIESLEFREMIKTQL
ncbi:unnamed protein product [Arctogadus glacialis]